MHAFMHARTRALILSVSFACGGRALRLTAEYRSSFSRTLSFPYFLPGAAFIDNNAIATGADAVVGRNHHLHHH